MYKETEGVIFSLLENNLFPYRDCVERRIGRAFALKEKELYERCIQGKIDDFTCEDRDRTE